MSLHAILLPMTLLLLALAPAPADEQADLKKLEGTWKAVKIVNDGQEGDVEQLGDQRLMIQGHQYTLKQADGSAEGELKLDPDQKPAHMDASYTTKDGDSGTVECIYKIEGGRLTICWGEGERPSTFAAESGSGYRLMVFERDNSK